MITSTRMVVLGGMFVSVAAVIFIFANRNIQAIPFTSGFAPHGYCILWEPTLLRVLTISDLLIGLSYMAISAFLVYFVYKARKLLPFERIFLAFGAFIFFCGVTHFMNIMTMYTANYWLEAVFEVTTAVASVITAVALPSVLPRAMNMLQAANLSETRRKESVENYRRLEAEIAERRRVEDELRAALEREQEVNRFRQNFVTRMSHEFRTPLSIIRSSSDLLIDYTAQMSPEKRNAKLTQIQTEVAHLNGLLDDILMVGKLEAGQQMLNPTEIDLDALCRTAVDDARASASVQQEVIYVTDSHAPVMACMDARLVGQILNNLISNAIKYSSGGGYVRVRLTSKDGWATLSVRDDGIGIPASDLPRIFDAFYRGENIDEIEGTGLGLAIVKQAVEAHGGTVTVESEEGRGTTFTVRLPLAPVKVEA